MKASSQNFTVKKVHSMSFKELLFFTIVSGFGIGSIILYAHWWFQWAHVATNGATFWSVNLFLFVMLSFVVWLGLFQRLAIWFLIFLMKKPVHVKPERGLKVAMLTCFVPGKEPYELLEKTLQAMVEIEYPHDSWVLDEGDDPIVKEMCRQLGVLHFSRKGMERYNQESGSFKAKTKAGNHNSWRDAFEYRYDLVAQMDMDHVPHKDYLTKTLGFFRDPKVAFVLAPQVYAKSDNWISTGSGEQAYIFNGPMQQGFYGHDMPLFIGTNHAYRPEAMREAGGYAATIVEDHLTGMYFYSKGWKGVYLPEVVAEGEGPGNWVEYFNQQMRWAYGIFEVLFRYSPKLLPKMSWPKRINYIAAQTYYLVGVAMVLGVFLTCIYLIFGYSSSNLDLWGWLKHSAPPFVISIFLQFWIQRFYISPKEESGIGWRGMLLSLGAMPIYAIAFWKALTRQKLQYAVTAKGSSAGYDIVPIKIFTPHLIIIGVSALALLISFIRNNDAPQLRAWSVFTIIMFMVVILSSRNLRFNPRVLLRPRPFTFPRVATLMAAIMILAVTSPIFSSVEAPANFAPTLVQTVSAESKKVATSENKIYLGISGGDIWNRTNSIEEKINKKFLIIAKYQAWGDTNSSFDEKLVSDLYTKGYIPMINWEPWSTNYPGKAFDQPSYQLKNIYNGNFDSYIQQYAIDVKKWNNPVIIRFAHEMNGNWYPWGAGVNGNTPEDYKQAWIHIINIFKQNEVKNVTWVWSPNETFVDSTAPYSLDFDGLYPGDSYVDWVGFSAYNWGTVNEIQKWRSFSQIVEPTYNILTRYNKPIMISEINSSTIGGDKTSWMRDMNFEILKYPKIRAVIWFESQNRNLFEINLKPESYSAF